MREPCQLNRYRGADSVSRRNSSVFWTQRFIRKIDPAEGRCVHTTVHWLLEQVHEVPAELGEDIAAVIVRTGCKVFSTL